MLECQSKKLSYSDCKQCLTVYRKKHKYNWHLHWNVNWTCACGNGNRFFTVFAKKMLCYFPWHDVQPLPVVKAVCFTVFQACANRKNLQSKSKQIGQIKSSKSSELNRALLRIKKIKQIGWIFAQNESIFVQFVRIRWILTCIFVIIVWFAQQIYLILWANRANPKSNLIDLMICPIREAEY